MKIKAKHIAAVAAAFAIAVTMSGCAAIGGGETSEEETEIVEQELEVEGQTPEINTPVIETPKIKTVSYLSVTADGVNLRSGAGTGYPVRGSAEKSTLYALDGKMSGWYKTGYKNKTAYLSSKYCDCVEMKASEDERIEAIIAEGTKLLGTAYVYGAIRYHDGKGNTYRNFTINEFDCSSLMQYIFYKGAGKLLQVNTRTQIYQGTTVNRSQLKRGDLMFFTNASRKNLSGIERVGHVALYLGDNWILHTASDYAKIEQISSLRWSYFIQGQRIF